MSEDWAAVGEVITERLRERKMTQKELAERSKVSSATIRQIQHYKGDHRHSQRTLEALSTALGLPPRYLVNVLNGSPQQETAEQVAADQTLQSRVDELEEFRHKISVVLEQRLGNVVDVIYNSDSEVDVIIQIKHARRDR